MIVLEGILALHYPSLRELMDIKIFVDTPDDIRFIRRVSRDVEERDRTVDSVINQYLKTVRPMHQQFVEPSKYFADIIIPEGSQNKVAIDLIRTKINYTLFHILSLLLLGIHGCGFSLFQLNILMHQPQLFYGDNPYWLYNVGHLAQ